MNIRWSIRALIGVGIVTTVMYLDYLGMSFFTGFAVFFVTWLMLPYLIWAFINEFRPNFFPRRPHVYILFAVLMPLIGVGTVGLTLLFPDPQAGMALLYIPLMQFACLVVAREFCK